MPNIRIIRPPPPPPSNCARTKAPTCVHIATIAVLHYATCLNLVVHSCRKEQEHTEQEFCCRPFTCFHSIIIHNRGLIKFQAPGVWCVGSLGTPRAIVLSIYRFNGVRRDVAQTVLFFSDSRDCWWHLIFLVILQVIRLPHTMGDNSAQRTRTRTSLVQIALCCTKEPGGMQTVTPVT